MPTICFLSKKEIRKTIEESFISQLLQLNKSKYDHNSFMTFKLEYRMK